MRTPDRRDDYEFFPVRGRGSCQARDAITGLRCRLPRHDDKTQHASERGPFRVLAMPGQTTFANVRQLEHAAGARLEVSLGL